MNLLDDWKILIDEQSLQKTMFFESNTAIHLDYVRRNENKKDIGFNVFTISSDLYYRENFHSDIIKSLLDPNEKHNEGSRYLENFIDLLNQVNKQKVINKSDFRNVSVIREKSNIDILITDKFSNKAIIIENKINNAVDQKRQLPRYLSSISENYDVVAIAYITLNSSKRPDKIDWTPEERRKIDHLIKVIPAFETSSLKVNLYKHWIVPSIIDSKNIDSSYLLRQYGNLIQYLNTNTMDTVSLGQFYENLKQAKNLDTAKSIRNMLNDLPEYLAIRIEDRYRNNCKPFKRVWRHKSVDTVFEGFEINGLYLKLDVWCSDEGYTPFFWETQNSEFDVSVEFKNKLEVLSEFQVHNNEKNKIKRHFPIFEEESLFEFIDNLLTELSRMANK